jgi:hypothetical protein
VVGFLLMRQEPDEPSQPPTRRRSRPATLPKSASNGDSPRSGRKETAEPKTEFEPGGPDGPPLGLVDYGRGEGDEGEELSESDVAPQGLLTARQLAKPVHLSTARYRIARAAMAILGLVVIASFVILWRARASVDDLTRVLEIIFAPIVALVGVTLAFYYRSNP